MGVLNSIATYWMKKKKETKPVFEAQFIKKKSNNFCRSLQNLCTSVNSYCIKAGNSFSVVEATEIQNGCQYIVLLDAETHQECQQPVFSRKQMLLTGQWVISAESRRKVIHNSVFSL